MRYLLSIILSLFCFVIPVYAVPDDFLLENVDNIDTAVYYDLSDTYDIYQGSFSNIVRSPSINPNVPFQFLGFTVSPYNEEYWLMSMNFEGVIPEPYDSFKRSTVSTITYDSSNGYAQRVRYNNRITYILLYDSVNQVNGPTVWTGDIVPTLDNNNFVVGQDVPTATFLSNVTQIFSWLLTSIGTLIVFIIGNPFLAVMLCLFLAGSVISFFIRIRG